MTAPELQLEHSVELEVTMNNKKTTLLTAIEKIIGPTTVLLTPIQFNKKIVGFPPNCMVNVYYADEKHAYCWKNVRLKAVRYGKDIYHCTDLVGPGEVMNRRGSYRVYIGEQMTVTAFTAQGAKKHSVHLKDISESGMAFLSSEEFDIGRIVRLNLSFAKGIAVEVSSQVVRIQELDNRQEKLYGCKFIEKNNKMVNYLMQLQQKKQREKMGLSFQDK